MEIMNVEEAADYVRLGTSTLNRFRVTGGGPRYAKLGGAVRYRKADLDAWIAGRVVRSTSEAHAA
ncbi:helix-turn-helix domain-containing protein [Citromicrobium bathyomarinum]